MLKFKRKFRRQRINLGARWGWVVNATPRPFYPRERPTIDCTGGWVGHRASLDGFRKSRPHRHSIPGPSSPYRVAMPTELSRPDKRMWEANIKMNLRRETGCQVFEWTQMEHDRFQRRSSMNKAMISLHVSLQVGEYLWRRSVNS